MLLWFDYHDVDVDVECQNKERMLKRIVKWKYGMVIRRSFLFLFFLFFFWNGNVELGELQIVRLFFF